MLVAEGALSADGSWFWSHHKKWIDGIEDLYMWELYRSDMASISQKIIQADV